MKTKMKGKAIICIAMIVAVLASAVGIVSGELFNVDDCPECPNAALPLPCGSFGLSIGNYNPVFASEPSLKVLSCLYNYNYGRADNPDSGVIKIGAYLSPDHGLDADKALSDFKYARKEGLEYCESHDKDILWDKKDGDDKEFVYIERYKPVGWSSPSYTYEVRGSLLYRENYLIHVNAIAEYKNQRERYCEPVGDSYACKFVDPTDRTHMSDENDAIIRFDALAECAKSVIDKKCGEKDNVAIIKPDKTSCRDFGVDPKDFDLAYDNKMLRKEFLDFLKDYGSKHELKSASEKYAGWDPVDFIKLGWFMFTTDLEKERNSKFMTGKENELGRQINERFKAVGRPLKPSEVFEESLKINDNCVFDALLTSHNYLKKQCYDLRETKRKEWKGNYDSKKKSIEKLKIKLEGKGVLDPFGQIVESPYLDEDAQKMIKQLDKYEKELGEMEDFKKNAETTFKGLKPLRSKKDNEGAWYHLFGTLTTGYAERENAWTIVWPSGYTRAELFLEHWGKWLVVSEDDPPEYCWDVWGGYLGGEIYSTLWDNQEKIKNRIKEHPEAWVKGEWEPSYILDAYTGQKIYE